MPRNRNPRTDIPQQYCAKQEAQTIGDRHTGQGEITAIQPSKPDNRVVQPIKAKRQYAP